MANIILDGRRLKAFEYLNNLAEYSGKEVGFVDRLWNEFLNKPALYEEFLYYLDNHTLKDSLRVDRFTLSDIYVYLIGIDNLVWDVGKNSADCNKEGLVLSSFLTMAELMDDPEKWVKKLSEDFGMDRM